MIGVLFLLVFLILGLAIANRVFAEEPLYIRAWSGLLIGLLGLMWTVVPFAFLSFQRLQGLAHRPSSLIAN